jgi:phosphatidylinositol glycan class B
VHNLIGHKEERFVFPIAVLATGLVTLALRSSPRLWSFRNGRVAKMLAGASFALMALLAVYPLGWNHHVRFTRFVHDHVGDELHAHALPDFELGLPAYHGRVYDVEKSEAAIVARRIEEGTAKPWLITDLPVLPPELEGRATLVWSELPSFVDPNRVIAYNARAKAPLRRLEYRSLWKITSPSRTGRD